MMKIYCKKINEILHINRYSIHKYMCIYIIYIHKYMCIYYKENFYKLQYLTSIQIKINKRS